MVSVLSFLMYGEHGEIALFAALPRRDHQAGAMRWEVESYVELRQFNRKKHAGPREATFVGLSHRGACLIRTR